MTKIRCSYLGLFLFALIFFFHFSEAWGEGAQVPDTSGFDNVQCRDEESKSCGPLCASGKDSAVQLCENGVWSECKQRGCVDFSEGVCGDIFTCVDGIVKRHSSPWVAGTSEQIKYQCDRFYQNPPSGQIVHRCFSSCKIEKSQSSVSLEEMCHSPLGCSANTNSGNTFMLYLVIFFLFLHAVKKRSKTI